MYQKCVLLQFMLFLHSLDAIRMFVSTDNDSINGYSYHRFSQTSAPAWSIHSFVCLVTHLKAKD